MDNMLKGILLTPFNILYRISPETELKLMFRLKCGYRLNLKNPTTYNEKIQWIKLYAHNPLMPICSDKYEVRKYVEDKGCKRILNTLIWEGYNPEDIPFDDLPDRCVIKVTHGSAFNIITTDTGSLNRDKVIKKCSRWLKAKYIECYGEWFYGQVKPRVIVEKYLDDGTGRLRDYKVYCFNGIPRFIGVDTGDSTGAHYKDIYDTDWNLMEGYKMLYPNSGIRIDKPIQLEALLEYARILSEDFLHARIDFYIVHDEIVFGEISFTNSAGFKRVAPEEFSRRMGEYLNLHPDERGGVRQRQIPAINPEHKNQNRLEDGVVILKPLYRAAA